MLARVTSAKDGIVEYLEKGMKSGRELTRDELDERVCIDGNISLTDEIIKQLNKAESNENYFHITLSFGERELTEEKIIEAYQEYKSSLMAAYGEDEYNIFAEIHYPKVKSYENKKTGELVERLPHVHIVLPQKNLLTDKALNPFGKYTEIVEYHDAIQEKVNRKVGLESPYDHQRKYGLGVNRSDFISRYKGDDFKGVGASVKKDILDVIDSKNIKSMADFEMVLKEFGDVSKGKEGQPDEYLQVKPSGAKKNIRLKEPCFQKSYIVDREVVRQKPSDRKVKNLVDAWENRVAHEIKHIRRASPKLRNEYYSLDLNSKREFLNEQIKQYHAAYHISEGRRTPGIKPGAESVGTKRFTQIPDGLPGLPQRSLVRTNRDGEREANTQTESVLPSNANNDMGRPRVSRDNKLRRFRNDRRNTGGITVYGLGRSGLAEQRSGFNTGIFGRSSSDLVQRSCPRTFSEQLLANHQRSVQQKIDLNSMEHIKKSLDPQRVLDYFEKHYGLVQSHYKAFRVKGGAGRINIGKRNFTVNDFCTQHMRLSWEDSKEVLRSVYADQVRFRNEKQVINSIAFASRYVTQTYTGNAQEAKLNESIRILKYLQRIERQGIGMALQDLEKYRIVDNFAQKNAIHSADFSLSSVSENFKRQQMIAKKLEEEFTINNLIANKDQKNKKIDFVDKSTGASTFTDYGDKLIMASRKPDVKDIAAAMTLASEKFGVVNITGNKDFKQKVIDVAVTRNLNIVFKDEKMNYLFQQQKEEFIQKNKEKENIVVKKDPTKEELKEELKSKVSPFALKSDGYKLIGVGDNGISNLSVETISDAIKEARKDLQSTDIDLTDRFGNKILNLKDGGIYNNDLDKFIAEEKKYLENSYDGLSLETQAFYLKMEAESLRINGDEGKAIEKENEVEAISEILKEGNNPFSSKEQPVLHSQFEKTEKEFDVRYSWSESDSKMSVTINGSKPGEIDSKLLDKIVAKDSFLQKHSPEAVRSGLVDMKTAQGVQPVPRTYNAAGEVMREAQAVKAPKLK